MGGIPWTKEEDQLLRNCIEQYGEGKWHRVPLLAGLNRCRKSCRLRWLNYLRPNIKRGSFEEEEVDLIIKLHKLLGNRWSLVAARLPGRTGNDVKNYWNCHLSKKLNAQETEDKNKHWNVQVMRPRASNYASTSSKRPYSTTLDQSPSNNFCQPVNLLAQEGGSNSSTQVPMPMPMPMLCDIGDGQNQMFQAEHDESNKNVPSVEEEHINDGINMGDFPMEGLPFKGVREYDQDDDADDDGVHNHNKWEWDDSVLGDVDLWTHC